LFSAQPEKRSLRRGTWYWEDDHKNMVPYNEEFAVVLEKAFKEGKFADKAHIDISDRKLGKIRWVQETSPGVFTQYRESKNRNPDGRSVVRGFKGQLIEKTVPRNKNL